MKPILFNNVHVFICPILKAKPVLRVQTNKFTVSYPDSVHAPVHRPDVRMNTYLICKYPCRKLFVQMGRVRINIPCNIRSNNIGICRAERL